MQTYANIDWDVTTVVALTADTATVSVLDGETEVPLCAITFTAAELRELLARLDAGYEGEVFRA